MPAMIVWPVSSSVWTRKVGSSSESLASAPDSLSWSDLVLGSIATSITGSGKVMDSSTIGCAGSQRVSPAVVGVHLQQPPDPLGAVLGGVLHAAARLEGARVHAEVGELAHVGVAHDLERQ